MGTPISSGFLRRYLKKNKMTAAVIATAKNRHTAVMYTIRASTLGAKLDACSGYNGSCDCTVLVCSWFGAAAERRMHVRVARAGIATPENQDAGDDREYGQKSTQADDSENRGAVPRG